MKSGDEKERNGRIEKLIDLLSQKGAQTGNKDIGTCLSDENWHNRDQTEEEYRKEQEAWLKKVAKTKKPAE